MKDALTKKILQHIQSGASPASLAARLGCTDEALHGRLGNLQRAGAIEIRVRPEHMGMVHELHVTGTPTHRTHPDALRTLAKNAGPVRTLASGQAQFCLPAADLDAVESIARKLAEDAGLEDVQTQMVVGRFLP